MERWKLSPLEFRMGSKWIEHLHLYVFLETECWSDEGTEEKFLQGTQKKL